ncbi:MAG: S49 family peptidase [Nitrospiraceae bacterium]|nr:S49 family peptidase [Nitrospiraceae bacterium]
MDKLNMFITNTQWALLPDVLDMLAANDIDALKAQFGTSKGQQTTQVSRKVAVIPVRGILTKEGSILSEVFGWSDTNSIQKQITSALNDSGIDAIVLDIDSPGGMVSGAKELADFIFKASSKKPIIAHGSGLMASAAYWIASGATKITAFDTSTIGSIGVYTVHYDLTGRDKQMGIKRTLISAGKNKTHGHDAEPLTDESRKTLQKLVDDIHDIFVSDVAGYRNLTKESVINTNANVYLARQAKSIGLIDRILTLDETVEYAAGLSMDEGYKSKKLLNETKALLDEITQFKASGYQEDADIEYGKELARQVTGEIRSDKFLKAKAETDEILKNINGGLKHG